MAMEIIKSSNSDEKGSTFAYHPQGEALGIFKGLALGLALCAFFLLPFSASAGVIRKPPNNLGLVAYWPMDEGAGTVVTDHSGNGRTGTFAGSLTFTPGWGNGKFGKALDFSGTGPSDGRIGITALNVTNTHTVSMWVYISSNCSNWGALFAANTGNGLYCLASAGGNRTSYFYSGLDHLSNTNISLNRWHHIAVTNNAGSATFYLDGVSSGTAASALAYSATVIGNDSSNEDFPGRIDDLRVYNRALSASEITYLYQSGSTKIGLSNSSPGTLADGLTGHWTFDGKDMVSNVADVSGNGRNGSLVGQTGTTTAVGKVGQALKFDGVNDYVNTNNTWDNFITTTDGTISAWIRPRGTAPSVPTGSIYQAPSAVSSLTIGSTIGIVQANNTTFGGDMIWAYNTTGCGSGYKATGVSYNTNEWIHVTWVHTGSTLYLYKNGDLATSTASGTTNTGCGLLNLAIGTSWAGLYWNGDIDDVRTWNRALSASEIKQVHNIGAGQKVSTTKTPVGTLQTGLVGHWTFDGKDMVSNVADVSGNGRNGTLTGFTSTTTTIGKIGQALTFDGTNDYVDIGNNSAWEPSGPTSFSVSFWYKGLKGTTESFLAHSPGVGNYWYINQDGAVFCGGTTCSVAVTKNYTLPSNNDWHHLVVVLDRTPSPDSLAAYIDGVAYGTAATGTLDNNSTTWGTNTKIGGTWWSNPTGYRQGSMDDVRIYNRTLSASEVKQLYNLGK